MNPTRRTIAKQDTSGGRCRRQAAEGSDGSVTHEAPSPSVELATRFGRVRGLTSSVSGFAAATSP